MLVVLMTRLPGLTSRQVMKQLQLCFHDLNASKQLGSECSKLSSTRRRKLFLWVALMGTQWPVSCCDYRPMTKCCIHVPVAQVVYRDPVRYKLQKVLTIAPEGVYSGQVCTIQQQMQQWQQQQQQNTVPTALQQRQLLLLY